MERDFMGLGSSDSYNKEEAQQCKQTAFSKASAAQWPLLNQVEFPPHFMGFKPAAEEQRTTTLPSAELLKVHDGPRGSPFRLPSYPDAEMFPIANQTISASTNNATFTSHFGSGTQNFSSVTMKQPLIGSSPVRSHPMHPSLGSVAGTTEPRFDLKHPGAPPPQLTIFYGGTVNVFDNISPEKAQAILYLAENFSAKMAQPRPQTQQLISKQEGGDGILFSPQLVNTTPNSGFSSPESVSSQHTVQCSKESRSKDEVMPIKPVTVLRTSRTRANPSSVTVSTSVTSGNCYAAVPLARKASLARFLEKRKERAVGSAPYVFSKISPECGTSSGFNSQ